jgi:hypothetical protein
MSTAMKRTSNTTPVPNFNCYSIELKGPNACFKLRARGNALHLESFEHLHFDLRSCSKEEWHLVFRYYGHSIVADGITLQRAKYSFNHQPNIQFIVFNQLIREAPLEVSYYRLFPYPNDQYQLVRTNIHGQLVCDDATIATIWT